VDGKGGAEGGKSTEVGTGDGGASWAGYEEGSKYRGEGGAPRLIFLPRGRVGGGEECDGFRGV